MAEFFVRIVFCFIVGNSDMHLKNFSLIETAEASGEYVLSPAYDLLPVNANMPSDQEQFALAMNGKKMNIRKGLYHKGTGTPRKTQARAPFAAQTDRERRKRAEMKSIQRVFGSSSDLHPVFLLFVRGRFRTAQVPDCPVRKQERSFATFYTNRLQNSMRKGAAA